MNNIILAMISFGAVFLKGYQQQNVVNGLWKSAGVFGFIMAVFDVAVISFVVESGWSSVIPVGLGASAGIMLSITLFNKIRSKQYS